MTLTATRVPGTAVVRLDHGDGLDDAAVRAARALLEAVVAERGGVRLLVVLAASGAVTPGRLREELGLFGEVAGIERAALVTDATWLRLAAKTQGRTLGFALRAFRLAAVDEALAWASA